MAKGESKSDKKVIYFDKLYSCLREYNKILVVNVDNVTSSQINTIRKETRGQMTLLMGKNTMIRRAIRAKIQEFPQLEKLLPVLRGNVGFVFTNGDLNKARDLILANKVAAPAKAGTIAPKNVTVPKGTTGMGPEKTSFFQALGISTKITKGSVEIVNDVVVIKEGDKVGQSEATLLSLLKIYPFSYGLTIKVVYEDGDLYEPRLLDLTQDHIKGALREAVTNTACLSLAAGQVNRASVPHIVGGVFKDLLAVSLESEHHHFALKDKALKAIEAGKHNASHAAHAAPAAAAAPSGGKHAPAAAAEPEEEEDDDMGFGLFD